MPTPLTIASDFPELIVVLAVAAAGITGILSAVLAWRHRIEKSRNRDQLQREIAAYVAEGSMTADEGERLIRAAGGEE
jgi:hypothetical protein